MTAGTNFTAGTERTGVFDIDRSAWTREGVRVAGVAGLFTLLSVATGGFVVVPVFGPVGLAVGVALPLGLLVGIPAAVGISVGVLLTAAVQSALSWWTAFDAVVYGGIAVIGIRLWGRLPWLASGREPGLKTLEQWLEFAAITTVATLTAAAALAWGAVIGWDTPFYAVALPEAALLARSTVLMGVVLLVIPVSFPDYGASAELSVRSSAFWAGVAAPSLWFLLATGTSLFVTSPRGQILVGGSVLSVLVVTYLPSTDADDQHSHQPTAVDS